MSVKLKLTIIVLIFFILSIILRLLLIFYSPYSIDSDQAITGLMAKHIMEGKFPVFFYGHAFDGPIESALASLFFLIFGISSYSLKLAPFIFGILFSFSTYFLARDIGGKKLGIYAFIFSLIPPIYLLAHYVAPRCCYIETLLFGNLIFISAIRLKSTGRYLYYGILGLVSGLAFWNSPLSIYYFISVSIFMLADIKKVLYLKKVTLCIICFIVASLPVWVYNLTHHFDSFKLGYSSPGISFAEIINRIFLMQMPGFLGSAPFRNIFLYWGSYICLLICIIYYFSKNIFRYKTSYCLLSLFFIIVMIIYGRSQYLLLNTQRHLLPLYTMIPVAVGFLCIDCDKKLKGSGMAIFSVLLLVNLYGSLLQYSQWNTKESKDDPVRDIISFLKENKLDHLYAPFWISHKINFFSKEEVICSEYTDEVYEGYENSIYMSDEVALIDEDFGGTKESLDRIHAGYKFKEIGGKNIFYNIVKPPYYGEIINNKSFKIFTNCNIKDRYNLIDKNYDTVWNTGAKLKHGPSFLEIDLGNTFDLYKLVILPKGDIKDWPGLSIYLSEDRANWEEIINVNIVKPFFWSGPRVYYADIFGRQEFIINFRSARYIKIVFKSAEELSIREVFVYRYLGDKEIGKDELRGCISDIVHFLESNGVKFVYADYWPSAKIRKFSNDGIKTLNPINRGFPYREYTDRIIRFKQNTAFILNKEDTELFERLLKEFNIVTKKKEFEYYNVYLIGNNNYVNENSLIWHGLGVIKVNIRDKSMQFLNKGKELESKGNLKGAIDYYKEAIKYYENNYLAYLGLLELDSNPLIREEYQYRFIPKISKYIKFKNNIEFLGYSIRKSKRLSPGRCFRIDYFWKLDRWPKDNIHVFVYFMNNGKIIFQNDHLLLEQFPYRDIIKETEVFKESCLVRVPNNIINGRYEIIMGLFLPDKKKRIMIDDPVEKRMSKRKIGELDVNN